MAYRMMAFIFSRQVCHFIHIRKTGGTAIKTAIGRGRKFAFSSKYLICLHSHNFTLNDVKQNEKCFFVLRDPISRFVSGFYSRKRQGRPANFYPWSLEEKKAFERFETPEKLLTALSSSDPQIKRKAESAMHNIAHVNSFYSDWNITPESLERHKDKILHIGYLNSLSEDFNILKSKLDLPNSIKLPEGSKAHKSPGTEEKTLSDHSMDLLAEWYSSDLRLMHYLQFS